MSGPQPKGGGRRRSDRSRQVRAPAGLPEQIAPLFRRLARDLKEHGVEHVDAYMLEGLAQAIWLRDLSFRTLVDEGLLTLDATHGGDQRKHPAFTTWRNAAMVARDIGMQYGLTLAARQRLNLADDEGEVSLAELLFAPIVNGDD